MVTLFQVCFYAGTALAVISFLLGHVFDLAGFDGADGIDIPILTAISLNPTVWLLFLVVFGGCGWLLTLNFAGMNHFLAAGIAFLAGGIVSQLVYRLIIKPLRRAQNTSAVSTQELVGKEAIVNETIVKGGYGEIRYVVCGNTYTSPCVEEHREKVEKETKVKILKIENGIFTVKVEE